MGVDVQVLWETPLSSRQEPALSECLSLGAIL